ncbi:MAG: hypothetical protein ACLUCH_05865, partial [Lachnospirales bacterium]
MYKKFILIALSSIFLFNIDIYANDINPEQSYFKIKRDNEQIINIENIEILNNDNNKIGNKNWSSAVILNNGNLLVGEYKSN